MGEEVYHDNKVYKWYERYIRDEWSMVRLVYMVRIVRGTISQWYENQIPRKVAFHFVQG